MLLVRLRAASWIIGWTVGIIPTYYVWHLRTLGRPWIIAGWILLLGMDPSQWLRCWIALDQ